MILPEPPNRMGFTELLKEWLALENQCGRDRDEAERHWHLSDEINRRAPAEDA